MANDTGERGIGLVVAMAVMVLLMGVTGSILPLAVTETAVSANHRRAVQTAYAADAGLELVRHELGVIGDWSAVLQGRLTSRFWSAQADLGLADGTGLDLQRITDDMHERAGTSSSPARQQWQLFASGSFDRLIPTGTPIGVLVVVVWVSDDAADLDDDPFTDTNATVRVRAAAFGPFGTRRTVEATVRRGAAGVAEVMAWRVDP